MDFKDDIVAISSPGGMGAISLIRVSGEKALEKVDPFFKSKSGKRLLDIKSHSMMFGEFTKGDELIDEVVVSFFDKDKSYTCLLYTSPSPRDKRQSRMPSSA